MSAGRSVPVNVLPSGCALNLSLALNQRSTVCFLYLRLTRMFMGSCKFEKCKMKKWVFRR